MNEYNFKAAIAFASEGGVIGGTIRCEFNLELEAKSGEDALRLFNASWPQLQAWFRDEYMGKLAPYKSPAQNIEAVEPI